MTLKPMQGTPRELPPRSYWLSLADGSPMERRELVMRLMEISDQRRQEFHTSDLGCSEAMAVEVLNRVAADGWLVRRERWLCPCDREREPSEALPGLCPECGREWNEETDLKHETVYARSLAAGRVAAWVVALHGMNTAGAWQEAFSWLFGTTWGRSVPVAVYKYGFVIAGVLQPWRRRALREALRRKLAVLRDQAEAGGTAGLPDVVAHSFGTWLFGHLIEAEAQRPPADRLRFGRVILLGSILRPDFPWKRYQAQGLVQEVLNHYATRDAVVPWAHLTIADSGPSGRKGFDDEGVLNIRAAGYGHSGLFSPEPVEPGGSSHLGQAYEMIWRPFLTLPARDLRRLPEQTAPAEPWRPLPWPLRGTLFPIFALPGLAALILLGVIGFGVGLAVVWKAAVLVAAVGVLGSLAMLTAAGAIAGWRKLMLIKER